LTGVEQLYNCGTGVLYMQLVGRI